MMSTRLSREAMMKRKGRTYSPEFKSKTAPAAIKDDLTMAEMAKKYDVHANQITEWKKQLLSARRMFSAIAPGRASLVLRFGPSRYDLLLYAKARKTGRRLPTNL
jgi:hypothetical protein